MVTPDHFNAYGIQLISGRSITNQDTAATVKVAMVNRDFVHKYLKGKDPLRRRVLVKELIPGVTKLSGYIPWQVVGTYPNVHTADQRDENPEMLIDSGTESMQVRDALLSDFDQIASDM